MAVSHKGAISFGLVHIPVALHTATQDNDIHFNQLHKEDKSRIHYKKVCAHCGKEVATSDIVKGFEVSDGNYVMMSDDDFEKAKTEKDKTIHILHFTDLNSIRPIYYDKTYHAVPETGGDKAFSLLRRAMLDENKVAIAKTVMGNGEKLLTIIPTEQGMLIETMFFADEIKEIPKEIQTVELSQAELSMAKTLINSMEQSFEPEQYHDEYQDRLKQIIEQKINGQDIVSPAPEKESNVIDIMEALKASIEQNKKDKSKSTNKTKGA